MEYIMLKKYFIIKLLFIVCVFPVFLFVIGTKFGGALMSTSNQEEWKKLVNDLGSNPVGLRRMAAKKLIVHGGNDTKVIEALKGALNDSDWEVRRDAIFALENRSFVIPEAVNPIGRVFLNQAEEYNVRSVAGYALGRIGGPAVKYLENRLSGPGDLTGKKIAADAFFHVAANNPKNLEGINSLIEVLGDQDRDLVLCASTSIEKFGHYAAPILRKNWKSHKSHRVQVNTTLLLRKIEPNDNAIIEQLISLLTNQDPYIRYRAAEGIGEAKEKGKNAVPTLIQIIHDPEPDVREKVAFALGEIGKPASLATNELVKLLNDEDQEIRAMAAYSLGSICANSKVVVPALIQGISDWDDMVRGNCAFSLGLFGPLAKDSVPTLIRMVENEEDLDLKKCAISALGRIGPSAKAALECLKKTQKNPELGIASLEAIRRISSR